MFFCYMWYYDVIAISYQYIWDMLLLYTYYCALLHWNAYHSCCAFPPSYFWWGLSGEPCRVMWLHCSYDPAPNSIQVTVSNQVLPRPTLEIFLDEDWPQHGSIPACQRSQVRPWCRKANALFQSLPNSTCTISTFFCVGGVRTHETADSLPWNIPVPSLG